MHCINWIGCIYEDMTLEQCFHNSQPLLPPLKGSWWNKHPKVSLKIVQMEGWDVRGGIIQGNGPHREGGTEKNRRKREKGKYNLIVKGTFSINIWTTQPRTYPRKDFTLNLCFLLEYLEPIHFEAWILLSFVVCSQDPLS